MKRLYVGNLPWDIRDEKLTEIFSEAGTVEEAVVVIFADTGRSKGFGFIEMSSEDEANKAIELFNEKEIEGRQIIVNLARPQEKRTNRSDY
jgi:RNA recognition motif-containing protein